MSLDREEQVTILYALNSCGRKGSKARIIGYILSNSLMKPREGDNALRQNRERAVENDLSFARQDLKEKQLLAMPQHGVWQITPLGEEKLFAIAKKVYEKKPEENLFHRYSTALIQGLYELGARLAEKEKARAADLTAPPTGL